MGKGKEGRKDKRMEERRQERKEMRMGDGKGMEDVNGEQPDEEEREGEEVKKEGKGDWEKDR